MSKLRDNQALLLDVFKLVCEHDGASSTALSFAERVSAREQTAARVLDAIDRALTATWPAACANCQGTGMTARSDGGSTCVRCEGTGCVPVAATGPGSDPMTIDADRLANLRSRIERAEDAVANLDGSGLWAERYAGDVAFLLGALAATGPARRLESAAAILRDVAEIAACSETEGGPDGCEGCRTLRYLRAEVGLSCGQAARVLGLTPAELSGVEWGRMTFENEADFEQAETMLRAKFVAPRGTSPPSK